MHSDERRGAHSGAHPPGRMANWDLVRIFLEVARIGSFRAAAGQLNMSANFLSKHILQLESTYKTTLMTRHVDGIRLTPEGHAGPRSGQADGGGLVRSRPDPEPSHARAERRGPLRHDRRARHLLAGAAAGRIPAGLFRAAGGSEMRDAIRRRLAARSRRRRAARRAGQARPDARQDRPASHHALRQPVLCRDLRHAEGHGRHPAKPPDRTAGCRPDQSARRCTTSTPARHSSALSRCATTSPARMSGPSPKAPASAGCRPTFRQSPDP